MKTIHTSQTFYIDDNLPLDSKNVISSLNNLNTEIPLIHRYYGLWFFNKEDKKFYTYKNSLTTPELLISDNNVSTIFGITVANYQDLLTQLNLYSALGKLIYIANLDVIFKFNGTNWVYESGMYKFNSSTELNNLPNSLKFQNCLVQYNNEIHIFNESLQLVNHVTTTNTTNNLNQFNNDNHLLNNRYFIHRQQLFRNFNNQSYKVGAKQLFIDNITLNNGVTIIHSINVSDIGVNNNPPYIKAILWINNNVTINNFSNVLKPVELSLYYKLNSDQTIWEVFAETDYTLSGKLELQF